MNEKYYNGNFRAIGDRQYVQNLDDVRMITRSEFTKLKEIFRDIDTTYLLSTDDWKNINVEMIAVEKLMKGVKALNSKKKKIMQELQDYHFSEDVLASVKTERGKKELKNY